MSVKVSYTKLLKEAIAQEWDQTKTVDVQGPMTDPILGYDGDGELQTHKDAASVLERYYFKERDGNDLIEHTDNEIDEEPAAINKTKKDIEDEIDDGESGSASFPKEGIDTDSDDDLMMEDDSVENSVIEKLIAEMENEEPDDDESDEEGDDELDEHEILEMDEEDSEETEELDVDKEVEGGAEEDEEEVEAEVKEALDAISSIGFIEEIDLDEELDILDETAGALGYAPPGFKGAQKGATDTTTSGAKSGYEDEELEEAFSIFQEEIEEDEVDDIDPKSVRV